MARGVGANPHFSQVNSFFLSLFSWLGASKARLWGVMAVTVAALALCASRLTVSEDVKDFFPKSDAETLHVLGNLKAMEKLTFIFQMADSSAETDDMRLIDAAEGLASRLDTALRGAGTVSLYWGEERADSLFSYAYRHLPALLTPGDYAALDSTFTPEGATRRLETVREALLSPAGAALTPLLSRDPLLLGLPVLERLRQTQVTKGLEMQDGYLFTADGRRLLMFVDLTADFLKTADNEWLATEVYGAIGRQQDETPDVETLVYGAPLVAVSNSARVKADEVLTLSISLSVLTVVMLLVFRSARAVALLIAPVGFGALFAMGAIAAMGVSLSQMAIGAGATILGLALSYSIHMMTHGLHAGSARRLIAEMAWPMTVGSVTTIGAFLALLFTGSTVLRHLGLFASLTLVGTLLFCLIFLPHLMTTGGQRRGGLALRLVERVAGYDYSRDKWLLGGLCATFAVTLFFFTDVRFNADMSALNYSGDTRLTRSLRAMEEALEIGGHRSTVVVTGATAAELASNARHFEREASGTPGLHSATSVASGFLPTPAEAKERAALWDSIFTPSRVGAVLDAVEAEGARLGFAPSALGGLRALLESRGGRGAIGAAELKEARIFADWVSASDSLLMLYYNVETDTESRDSVFTSLAAIPHTVLTDMGYYSRQMARQMVDDFNWLLLLSSFVVAAALIASYGRVELFLLTFTPMCVSWVIILGLMAIFGVEFNVVNIILSTFIFGVGDDYAIFIMDGLQAGYARGQKIMSSHKTAIVLSAFAAIAGLGAQVFGRHPAVHSLGLISIFGLVAVIVTSFVVQPVLFRLLISGPARRGGVPYTLPSLLRGVVAYTLYGVTVGMVLLAGVALRVAVHPAGRRRRAMRVVAWRMTRLYLAACRGVVRLDVPEGLAAMGPSVIVANHQSFLDVLALMAASPRLVFVVKGWVSHAPMLGLATRQLGFFSTDAGGPEALAEAVSEAVADGCSVVIFPEGSRSGDSRVRRFHKGAAALAARLRLPIVPIAFYGHGMAVSKLQPLNIMRCRVATRVLPTVGPCGAIGEAEMKEISRGLQHSIADALSELRRENDRDNVFFRDMLLRGFVFRGQEEYALAKKFVSQKSNDTGAPSAWGGRLCLDAFWEALTSDDTHFEATAASEAEADFCRRSPLVGYLEAQGKRITIKSAHES